MERLIEIKMSVTGFCFVQDAFDKLAAYEDTGLTPKQIQAQRQDIESLQRELNAEISVNEALTADKDEQAGRIMELEEALKCLHDLLEEHGPLWYLRKHHNKAIDALLGGKEDGSSKDE